MEVGFMKSQLVVFVMLSRKLRTFFFGILEANVNYDYFI